MDQEDIVNRLRSALQAQTDTSALLDELEQVKEDINPTTSVDLLERSCAAGDFACVRRLYSIFDYFVYQSWALMLAIRCDHERIARWLIENQDVDLLAPIYRPPCRRFLLPHDGAFTRNGLTRSSSYLFLHPQDPTISTYLFTDFTAIHVLEGNNYSYEVSLDKICSCIKRMAADGLFDELVFDDIFRACMVKAWRYLRHPDSRDEKKAQVCLDLALDMMKMKAEAHGDMRRMKQILASLIVPNTDKAILYFIADNASDVCMTQIANLDWLQNDIQTLSELVGHLSPGKPEENQLLFTLMAKHNFLDQVKIMEGWPKAIDSTCYALAIDAASEHQLPEMAAYLLGKKSQADRKENDSSDSLDDFISNLLL